MGWLTKIYKDSLSLGLFTKIYKDLKFLLMAVILLYYIFQSPANYHSKMMKLVFVLLILQLALAASSPKKDHTQAASDGLISYKNPEAKALPETLAAAKKNLVKRQAGCGCGGQRAVFDRSCASGGLGCNACGVRLCRFCGFGNFNRC